MKNEINRFHKQKIVFIKKQSNNVTLSPMFVRRGGGHHQAFLQG